ncbi:MAG: phosphotransferase [Solirubrobacteraceae bacterium]
MTVAAEVPGPIAGALPALEARLGPRSGPVVALTGGITNRNYRVRLGGADLVVRILGAGGELLGIDRPTERLAGETASALGIGPELVAFLPEHDCLVSRFLPGRALEPGELRAPVLVEALAAMLRALHASARFPATFDAFTFVQDGARAVIARGGALPVGHADAARIAARIRGLLTGPEHAPVPCHNDLLPGNLLRDGDTLWLLDWDYAATGDRYFDLANASVNNLFGPEDDERLLSAYFGEPCPPHRLARLRLMRVMSDFREGMWGAVQTVNSDLDEDYAGYARQHIDRMLDHASSAEFDQWCTALEHGA